jgi:hypothetical protein
MVWFDPEDVVVSFIDGKFISGRTVGGEKQTGFQQLKTEVLEMQPRGYKTRWRPIRAKNGALTAFYHPKTLWNQALFARRPDFCLYRQVRSCLSSQTEQPPKPT